MHQWNPQRRRIEMSSEDWEKEFKAHLADEEAKERCPRCRKRNRFNPDRPSPSNEDDQGTSPSGKVC